MFTDIDKLSKEAQDDIQYCVEHGLLRGVSDTAFAPDLGPPRWQLAIVLARLHRQTKESPDHIAARVAKAVAMIVDEQIGQLGSGGSAGAGYYWTNCHVVTRPDGTHPFMVAIRSDSGPVSYAMGPIVALRPEKDLAIVRADIGEDRLLLPRLDLATAPLTLGEPLTIFGSPVGLIGSVTHGVVSYLNRGLSYKVAGVLTAFKQVIQTDAPINPGNSGGVAVNRFGQVVGVPSAKLAGTGIEGLGFCISVEDLREVLAEVELANIPRFSRPAYEQSAAGFTVSVQTHPLQWERVTNIVVHHTGDTDAQGRPIHRDVSAEAINNYHRSKTPPWAGIGYHFVIRWDGRIEIGRSIYTQGSHAGEEMNPKSWGVVFSGNFDVTKPTLAQLASWRWLRKYLNEVKPGLVVSVHRDHSVTNCPGKNLTREELEK